MKASLNFLHHETSGWLRELKFYKEEITLLSERLGEVVQKNTGKDVLAQAEHFQNRFILLNEQCDELRHEVNLLHEAVAAKTKAAPTHTNEHTQEPATALQARVNDYTKSFADTRHEFNKFLSTVF